MRPFAVRYIIEVLMQYRFLGFAASRIEQFQDNDGAFAFTPMLAAECINGAMERPTK